MRDRILTIRNDLHLSQRGFGDRFGLSKDKLARMENGSREIDANLLQKLVEHCKYNPRWLLTGEGEMLGESAPAPSPSPTQPDERDAKIITLLEKDNARLETENEKLKEELKMEKRVRPGGESLFSAP